MGLTGDGPCASNWMWERFVKLFFVGYSVAVVVIVVFLKSSSLFSSLTSTHSAVFIAQRLRSIPSLLNFFSLFFCVRIFYFHPQPPTLFFLLVLTGLHAPYWIIYNSLTILFPFVLPLSYISLPFLSYIASMDDSQTAFAIQYPYAFDIDMMKVSSLHAPLILIYQRHSPALYGNRWRSWY